MESHPKPINCKSKSHELPFSKYIFKPIPGKTRTVVHRPSDIIFQNGPTHIVINHPKLVIQPAPVLFHNPAAIVSGRKALSRLPVQPPVNPQPVESPALPEHFEHQHVACPKNDVLLHSRLFNSFKSSNKPKFNFPANDEAKINQLNIRNNGKRYHSGRDEEHNQHISRPQHFQQHHGMQTKFAQQRNQQEEAIVYNENLKQQREQSQRHVYYQPEIKREIQQKGLDEEEIETEDEIDINENDTNELRADHIQFEQIPKHPVQQQKSFEEEEHFDPRDHHRSMQ